MWLLEKTLYKITNAMKHSIGTNARGIYVIYMQRPFPVHLWCCVCKKHVCTIRTLMRKFIIFE